MQMQNFKSKVENCAFPLKPLITTIYEGMSIPDTCP